MVGETTAGSLDPEGKTISISFAGTSKKKKKSRSKMVNGGKCKMKKMSKFIKWETTYKNDLPDSAFAIVLPGGKKDSEGKTVPRGLRKLPFKDMEGKVDVPHLRNASARVAQGKTDLSSVQRSKAMSVLKSYAKKYLKTHKETKSGQVMAKYISKFAVETSDRLEAIIKVLKEKATNLKPEDDISLKVKQVSLLIQDLEEIVEVEKSKKEEEPVAEEPEPKPATEEDKDPVEEEKPAEVAEEKEDKKPAEEEAKPAEKPAEKPVEEEKKEEKPTEEKPAEVEEETKLAEEEESKFQQAMEVANGYRKEIGKQEEIISKFQSELKLLKEQNAKLTTEFSKFKDESRTRLIDMTIEKISKFKGLNSKETWDLKKKYLESKMSDAALVTEGRKVDIEMISKLQEPKATTRPSEMLEPAEETKQSYSKMSGEDKLDVLAKLNAKQKGFVVIE